MFTKFTIPGPLRKGSHIGITGPSGGVNKSIHGRLDLVITHLRDRGFLVTEGNCLRDEYKHVSADKNSRAKELQKFLEDDNLDAICPPWGGEVLIEILPKLDFKRIINSKPKWITSYSDISTLHFALTTITGICTAHTPNLMDLVPPKADSKDSLTYRVFDVLGHRHGDSIRQNSSEYYQDSARIDFQSDVTGVFMPNKKTKWKSLRGETSSSFEGRLIGGCLDTISCLTGTPFGNLDKFKSASKDSGFIFYFENCEGPPTEVVRRIENIKQAGWLEGVKGILIGRSCGPDATSERNLSYLEALQGTLDEIKAPVIYDADIGHSPPQMTLLNGAKCEVAFENGKASLIQRLEP